MSIFKNAFLKKVYLKRFSPLILFVRKWNFNYFSRIHCLFFSKFLNFFFKKKKKEISLQLDLKRRLSEVKIGRKKIVETCGANRINFLPNYRSKLAHFDCKCYHWLVITDGLAYYVKHEKMLVKVFIELAPLSIELSKCVCKKTSSFSSWTYLFKLCETG